jgi:hypothetical protein
VFCLERICPDRSFLVRLTTQALYPSELSDGGNVTWGNGTADATGTVNFNFPSIRFDELAADFGNYLFGTQGWAIGACMPQLVHRASVMIVGAGLLSEQWVPCVC